jgi:hypothetical protein
MWRKLCAVAHLIKLPFRPFWEKSFLNLLQQTKKNKKTKINHQIQKLIAPSCFFFLKKKKKIK